MHYFMNHIIIIGGGITGLAAAYRLRQTRPDVAITLIEKEATLGGKIQTERTKDGFVIEGGPDSFLSRKPRGVGLAREVGLGERLQGRNAQFSDAFIKRRGKLHPLPEGITGMVPTNLEALERSELLSAEGRARWAAEATVSPRLDEGDESIAEFVTRRMGEEVFQELVEPLMVGIYAGDATQLSIQATFPNLRRLERDYGSLLEGLQQTTATTPSEPLPPFVTLPSGTAELVENLTTLLAPTVAFRLGCSVTTIEERTHAVSQYSIPTTQYTLTLSDQTTLLADALILATPAFVTADLVESIDSELAKLHREIPYASSVIVTLAFEDKDRNQGFADKHSVSGLAGRGYIIPTVEDTDILAATASSNKWHGRAPQGKTLFRLFIGRSGKQDATLLTDEALIEMARTELEETLGITQAPLLTRVHRWQRGMPQYTLGHLDRLAAIEARLEAHPHLALAGAAYRGVGIPDCIASGEEAAQRILALVSVQYQ
jgi:oxygen-dependent protoporphyrinogen oxidase